MLVRVEKIETHTGRCQNVLRLRVGENVDVGTPRRSLVPRQWREKDAAEQTGNSGRGHGNLSHPAESVNEATLRFDPAP